MYSAISQKLLDAQTEVDSVGVTPRAFKGLGVVETTHYIEWDLGVSVGVVEIESAADPDYGGTWAPVSTVTFSGDSPKVDYVRVQGVYPALRHRISTPVDGGSVTTRIMGSV